MAAAQNESLRTLAELASLIGRRNAPDVMRFKCGGAWHTIGGSEVSRRVARLALSLSRLGIRRGDRVALLSENRPEWAIADLAILCCGAVNVPLCPTLTSSSCEFILNDSGARAIFVSSSHNFRTIAAMWEKLPRLELAVQMDDAGAQPGCGHPILEWSQLCPDGPLTPEERHCFEEMAGAVQPGDVASLVYTSGTTGTPKGVMLSHANLVSNVLAIPEDIVSPRDIALSFLPLSHVYERLVDYVFLYRGVPVAYAKSIEAVPRSLLEIRPTITAAVPRFFEKLYMQVLESLRRAGWLRRKLFWWAVGVGRRELRHRIAGTPPPFGLRLRHWIADRLIFAKLRARLGGRIRCFVSGGAPLARELCEFFNSAGITVCEGYGLTETSPVVATTLPSRLRPGTVGLPLEGVEVRIAVDGEILVRGPNVMLGYHNQPEETARALARGWLHTGDVGELTLAGELCVTDRKKDLLKTAAGKFVAPQPIENLLRASGWLLNAVVIGDRRPYAAALLVPNTERLKAFAAERGIRFSSLAELLKHADVLALIEQQVRAVNAHLAPFEHVKRFALLDHDFSVEEGTLTTTLKVRRKLVEERYADVIAGLYARG
jgi:long-chain acyl-CoA synthetase